MFDVEGEGFDEDFAVGRYDGDAVEADIFGFDDVALATENYKRYKFDIRGGEREKEEERRPWLKTGVEFFEGRLQVSTVSANAWADWSLLPLPLSLPDPASDISHLFDFYTNHRVLSPTLQATSSISSSTYTYPTRVYVLSFIHSVINVRIIRTPSW